LVELRELGELGQLLLGLKAGYTVDEISVKREWTALQRIDVLKQLDAYGERV